jgi:endonuclease/exonuclease/phosphatase family metal-dependent hydrolase
MRIATYNVEWFDNLFDDWGRLIEDNGWSGRRDVTRAEQTEALGHVFRALDADAIMVIEAPDTNRRRDGVMALESFAARFDLRARTALIGFPTQTQQEIALLYDPDILAAVHDPGGTLPGSAPRFDRHMRIDLDIDGRLDTVVWSKPPLEATLTTQNGQPFHLIGVHAKSKAPHGARSHAEVTRISIENRRKQLAECVWLRHRVDERLTQDMPLIVLGDFNDGPGLDEYEKLFNRSGVEIVLGEGNGTPLYDPHTFANPPPATARFQRRHGHGHIPALIDFIMVSPDLRTRNPVWWIWHPHDDPTIRADRPLASALLTASDHFPVTLDFTP